MIRYICSVLLAMGIIIAILSLIPVEPVKATDWGYPQEQIIRAMGHAYVKMLEANGITARFKFYEDGSWHVVGCAIQAPCSGMPPPCITGKCP